MCAVKSRVYIMDLVFTAPSGQAQLGKFDYPVPDGYYTVHWFQDQIGTCMINFVVIFKQYGVGPIDNRPSTN